MSKSFLNPFLRLAKSNDLTDRDIQGLWVDFVKDDETVFFDPTNPMATIVLGGKGSGKSHLFRYYSFPVQGMRHQLHQSKLTDDRYLGVYIRAGGLNAARFGGKGIPDDQWIATFSYYLELWFAQELLNILVHLRDSRADIRERERSIVEKCLDLFSSEPTVEFLTFDGLLTTISSFQRDLDRAIDEAAFSREIRPQLCVSSGHLIFGIPKIVCETVPSFSAFIFCYYVDEYENFQEYQQQYVNTLLRERERPVTFRIGARAYGMRTYCTFSGVNEEIQEGSEFQYLKLDARFRKEEDAYGAFARKLLARRIERSPSEIFGSNNVDDWFDEEMAPISYGSSRTRPHLAKARDQFGQILSPRDLDKAMNLISHDDPIVEKAAIFRMYQAYAKGEYGLLERANKISDLIRELDCGERNVLYETISHYRDDFRAQLRQSPNERSASYHGLTNFITMSEGLPRVLLTIVGNIVAWAAFRGELPIVEPDKISSEAQRLGLMETSEWFLLDLPNAGLRADSISTAINRLGELLRLNRLADKPVECSLISFSVKLESLSDEARATILEAERRSFLVEQVFGQKDRSSKDIRKKYQLNRMLSPYFGLPIGRRGAARFDTRAAEAIFNARQTIRFNELRNRWQSRLNWPFGTDMKENMEIEF